MGIKKKHHLPLLQEALAANSASLQVTSFVISSSSDSPFHIIFYIIFLISTQIMTHGQKSPSIQSFIQSGLLQLWWLPLKPPQEKKPPKFDFNCHRTQDQGITSTWQASQFSNQKMGQRRKNLNNVKRKTIQLLNWEFSFGCTEYSLISMCKNWITL